MNDHGGAASNRAAPFRIQIEGTVGTKDAIAFGALASVASAAAGLCGAYLLTGWAWLKIPPDQRVETTIGVVTVLAAALLAYFTMRRTLALDQQNRNQAAQLAQQKVEHEEQLALQRSEHQSERFSRAIDQIGASAIGMRLGGIYALEALAKDAPEGWAEPIYANFVAYILDRSPLASSAVSNGRPTMKRPDPDIAAIFTVLSRSRPLFDNSISHLKEDNAQQFSDRGRKIPTSGVHIVGVDLSGRDFSTANFRGATLTRTHFGGAMLMGAEFADATLTGCFFLDATLVSSFKGATLVDCCFEAGPLKARMNETTRKSLNMDATLEDTKVP